MARRPSAEAHYPPPTAHYRPLGSMFLTVGDPQSLASSPPDSPNFDIFEWHPAYVSCQTYFLNHAQHEPVVQSLAALINICLPYQWPANPIFNAQAGAQAPTSTYSPASHAGMGTTGTGYSSPYQPRGPTQPLGSSTNSSRNPGSGRSPFVSLVPYIRRLVVTGFDGDGILHGFFGDDWRKGVGPLQECERRNYLFAAKSVGWAKVKYQYDMSPNESVPFLKPLQNVQLAEIENAEKTWSQWLMMEDWMVGPRAPMEETGDPSARRDDGTRGML
ncbi:hypothetical protein EJ06DRAFT_538518 [Trichodelitschia bisporula]|uniref:Ilp is an apoptosis inhibitor n=1 Tax=Trichodelitschia bisporula TaxID=703511 RepID=A0A6G1HSS2_9PEZI|nr:hypothetical protein EJ06DRAFT_538518 [Trichodelitschia bisporula]